LNGINISLAAMSNKSTLKVYSPESTIRRPLVLLKSMLSDIRTSKELAWRLFIRNISAMYRQSFLGYIWAFLPPIATTLVWVFLNSSNIVDTAGTKVPYPVYVMIGTLLWQIFVDAINSPLNLVTSSKAMLIKINFPREALIIAGIYEIGFNFLIRLALFAGILILYKVTLPISIFLAPIGIIAIILLGLVIGIGLTPAGLLYQDIGRGLLIITSVWFYLTPVVYPTPTSFPANLVARYNPISPLIITTREWITSGYVENLGPFITVSIASLGCLFMAWILYRIAMPHIIARMGS
jgi:lipopolysaccharide transport system permease protein